jgi:hypothetical protein
VDHLHRQGESSLFSLRPAQALTSAPKQVIKARDAPVDPDVCVGVSWLKERDVVSPVDPDICIGVSWLKEKREELRAREEAEAICIGVSWEKRDSEIDWEHCIGKVLKEKRDALALEARTAPVDPDVCVGVSWMKEKRDGTLAEVDPDVCVGVSWVKARDAEKLAAVDPDVCIGVSWAKRDTPAEVDPDVCIGVSW